MHSSLESLKSELAALASQISSTVTSNEPLNVAHNNWSFPGITRDELVRLANETAELIEEFGSEQPPANSALLTDYARRLVYLRGNTVPQFWSGNAALAVQAYETTINALDRALREGFGIDKPVTKDDHLKAIQDLKKIQNSIRNIEARVNSANSRSAELDAQITAIQNAHQAAEQLPTDLATLSETRAELARLLQESKADRAEMSNVLAALKEANDAVAKSSEEATAVLGRADAAYRAATTQGLASAFAERSRGLNTSMWVWVVGLIAALAFGAHFGGEQLKNVLNVVRSPDYKGADTELWIHLLLAIFSVAAPVWFAWLSTKQIGQRFRLAEDYGYKSSISRAYEGYRREAALLEPAFQQRLFSSALTRLDELPLRLVETDSHGSPWHELFASDAVQKALTSVPGFAETVKQFAESALDKLKPRPAAATGAPPPTGEPKTAG